MRPGGAGSHRDQKVSSQSTLSRFFSVFESAGKNQQCFGPSGQWCLKRVKPRKEGYSLDFDSTRLLHEDGHQEGGKTRYTRVGLKPCLHPLLAVLEEAMLVAGFWLRPGNTSYANNIVGFTLMVLGRLPKWLKVRLVRADSGFYENVWLPLLEGLGLSYIVVARLMAPLRKLIVKGMDWQPTGVPGVCVSEIVHHEKGWKHPRRLIVVRHEIRAKRSGRAAKSSLKCPDTCSKQW